MNCELCETSIAHNHICNKCLDSVQHTTAPEVEAMAKALEEMYAKIEECREKLSDCGSHGTSNFLMQVLVKPKQALAAYNQATEHLRR